LAALREIFLKNETMNSRKDAKEQRTQTTER